MEVIKNRILWVSDSPEIQQVGQSRVTREFCHRLVDRGFDVHVAGFIQEESLKNNPISKFTVHPLKRFETEKLIQIIEEVKPEIMVLSHDPFLFKCLNDIRAKFGGDITIIGYYTIDGEPLSYLFRDICYNCDWVVLPSNYGERTVKRSFFDLNTSVIPYGVNTDLYNCGYKAAEKDKSKKDFSFGFENIDFTDKVIYLYVGNNQGRKNVGCARDAFKKFYENHKDVIFLLVMKSTIMEFGDFRYVGHYDVLEFDHPAIRIATNVIGDEAIARLYKSADFLIHPTIGEGFGLSVLESMAGKCVPIVTNFSAVTDFCNDNNSILLKNFVLSRGDFDVYRAIVGNEELLECLEHSYDLKKNHAVELEGISQNAQDTANTYSWDKSADSFVELFNKVRERKQSKKFHLEVVSI